MDAKSCTASSLADIMHLKISSENKIPIPVMITNKELKALFDPYLFNSLIKILKLHKLYLRKIILKKIFK